ncbi:hypothetical protein HNR42_001434 [Deinobacterium chartae]|uniref:Lipoprotein n=1 Tax=Deinobacterium chartae TaxID=521158 RepID=A0A841HWW5_9DEIO|nr:hypothetical protein [Deinobacterium chartae]MBB6098011.1 hypothetical protein [Deinobacterium chartae]
MRSPYALALPGLAALALVGCAPQQAVPRGQTAPLRGAFSTDGVVWTNGRQAFVAELPSLKVRPLGAPGPVSAVNWWDGAAWMAVPSSGWLLRAEGPAEVRDVGAITHLSARYAYRPNGSVLTAQGALAGFEFDQGPRAVLSASDGLDYVLLEDRLYRVSAGLRELVFSDLPLTPLYLVETPQGVRALPDPTVYGANGFYRLHAGYLERYDPAGGLRARVRSRSQLIGLVQNLLIGVNAAGELETFDPNFTGPGGNP